MFYIQKLVVKTNHCLSLTKIPAYAGMTAVMIFSGCLMVLPRFQAALFFAFAFGGRFFVFGWAAFGFVVFIFGSRFGFAFVGFAVFFVIGLSVFVVFVVGAVVVRWRVGLAFDNGFNQLGLAGVTAVGDFERLPCLDAVAFDFVERGKLGYVHVVAFGDAV